MQKTISSIIPNSYSDEFHPTLIVDERERRDIRNLLLQSKLSIQIETLPIADYLITNDIAVERKRGDDLAGSLCDTRFFTQLIQLSTYYSHPILLLEDFNRMFTRNIYDASLYGALLYTCMKLGIRIIPSKNAAHSVSILRMLIENYQKSQADVPKILKFEKEPVNRSAQLYFLQGLLDVSEKRSKTLLNEFGTPWEVLKALIKTELKRSKKGRITGISGPLQQVKGLGAKFLLKNHMLLRMPFEKSKMITPEKLQNILS